MVEDPQPGFRFDVAMQIHYEAQCIRGVCEVSMVQMISDREHQIWCNKNCSCAAFVLFV